MKSRRRHHRSKWAHCNTHEAKRRIRAKHDAEREAIAATLPPAYSPPEPLTHWQRIVIDLYVPTCGRCDQHAVGDRGQRYEVTFFNPATFKRQVLGWCETREDAERIVATMSDHPVWEQFQIVDRGMTPNVS